jgi:hypothetical protein
MFFGHSVALASPIQKASELHAQEQALVVQLTGFFAQVSAFYAKKSTDPVAPMSTKPIPL